MDRIKKHIHTDTQPDVATIAEKFYNRYLPLLERLAEKKYTSGYEEPEDFLHDAYVVIHQAVMDYKKNALRRSSSAGIARWRRKNSSNGSGRMSLEVFVKQALNKLFAGRIGATVVLKKGDQRLLLSPCKFQKSRAYYMSLGYEVEFYPHEVALIATSGDGEEFELDSYREGIRGEIDEILWK